MAPAALLLLLVALGAYLWRRRQRRKRADARPAQVLRRGPPLLALSGMFLVLGIAELMQPRHPPFNGKFGHLLEGIYASLGPHGIAALWIACALMLAGFTWLVWRRDEALLATVPSPLREL